MGEKVWGSRGESEREADVKQEATHPPPPLPRRQCGNLENKFPIIPSSEVPCRLTPSDKLSHIALHYHSQVTHSDAIIKTNWIVNLTQWYFAACHVRPTFTFMASYMGFRIGFVFRVIFMVPIIKLLAGLSFCTSRFIFTLCSQHQVTLRCHLYFYFILSGFCS